LPSIAAQRLVAGYALPEEQPFDPVDVLDPFTAVRLSAEGGVDRLFVAKG
jgi:hypothetical protein